MIATCLSCHAHSEVPSQLTSLPEEAISHRLLPVLLSPAIMGDSALDPIWEWFLVPRADISTGKCRDQFGRLDDSKDMRWHPFCLREEFVLLQGTVSITPNLLPVLAQCTTLSMQANNVPAFI